jgi:hypothetical protein
VADIAPSISPSTINIKLYLEKMNSIDINSLDLNLHKARKQVDEILCELPVLKQVFKFQKLGFLKLTKISIFL